MTTPTDLKTLIAGDYAFTMSCPECDRDVTTPITLGAVLTVNYEGGKLRPSMTGTKQVEHSCTAEQVVPLFEGNGQAPFDDTE